MLIKETATQLDAKIAIVVVESSVRFVCEFPRSESESIRRGEEERKMSIASHAIEVR